MRIGRLAGIDIIVHWSWLVIFFFLAWSLAEGLFLHDYPSWTRSQAWLAGAITSLMVFASVLIHELSHSLVARRQGINVSSITLFIFGGVSSLTEEPRDPRQEFTIAAVGPATSLLLAGLFAIGGLVFRGGIGTASFYLAFINAVLGAFNLLPGFPLDGGRILRAAAWARDKNLVQATRVASTSGTVIAYVLMAGGLLLLLFSGILSGLWFILIGWFLLSQAKASYEQVVTRDVLQDVPVNAATSLDFHPVSPELNLDAFVSDYVLRFHQRTYPVAEGGDIRGLVSLVDLKKYPRDEWPSRRVSDVMTPRDLLHVVSPSDSLATVAELLARGGFHQLPVMSNGHFIGFVTRAGIIRLIQTRGELMNVEAARQTERPESGGPAAKRKSTSARPHGGPFTHSTRGSAS
jgi:Zn-dependent protease/CBS domain-containing protein